MDLVEEQCDTSAVLKTPTFIGLGAKIMLQAGWNHDMNKTTMMKERNCAQPLPIIAVNIKDPVALDLTKLLVLFILRYFEVEWFLGG